jgi:hypothetical protein
LRSTCLRGGGARRKAVPFLQVFRYGRQAPLVSSAAGPLCGLAAGALALAREARRRFIRSISNCCGPKSPPRHSSSSLWRSCFRCMIASPHASYPPPGRDVRGRFRLAPSRSRDRRSLGASARLPLAPRCSTSHRTSHRDTGRCARVSRHPFAYRAGDAADARPPR